MVATPPPSPAPADWKLTVEQTLPAGGASKDVWVGLTTTGTTPSAACVTLAWYNVRKSLHADFPAVSQQRCETERDAHLVLPQQSYFVLVSVPAFRSGMEVDLILDVVSWKADEPMPTARQSTKVRGSFALK
jgi:hypothetical protein